MVIRIEVKINRIRRKIMSKTGLSVNVGVSLSVPLPFNSAVDSKSSKPHITATASLTLTAIFRNLIFSVRLLQL